MEQARALEISLWKLRVLGWVCVAFFSFCFIGSWVSDQRHVSPWFIPFILLAIPILIQAGKIRCDTKAISLHIPLGDFEIEWNDIKRIERGQSFILLIDGDRRLNIPTPEWWAGSDKKLFARLIETFIEERKIEVEESFLADFRFPKETRTWPNKRMEGNG